MKFSIKLEGLSELKNTLDGLKNALSGLDGRIATVSFNPNDEASIANAIREIENEIDRRMAPYANNSLAQGVGAEAKTMYAKQIRRRAEELRVKPD